MNITEKEKARRGEWYDANFDPQLIAERAECRERCHRLNLLRPAETEERDTVLREIIGKTGRQFEILSPFLCDYGYNIEIGENFFANFGLTILDEATVRFGDNVFIGPNCGFYTASHPLDTPRRNRGLERALPISVGDNVWFGAQVCVLPGVSIGSDCVIGAGSVVTRDIPSGVVAAGNPCRVIRPVPAEAESAENTTDSKHPKYKNH